MSVGAFSLHKRFPPQIALCPTFYLFYYSNKAANQDTNNDSSNEEVVLLHRAANKAYCSAMANSTALSNSNYSKITHFSLEITWKHTKNN